MPIFEYQALDAKGRNKKGTVDADTARDAREKLRRQDVRVTRIERVEASTKRAAVAGAKAIVRRKANLRDLAILTRQLSTLLRAGIHLSEALNVLVEQAQDHKTELVLRDLREKIVGGASLADSLSYHPRYFSDLYINMVRAGEASGNLDQVLSQLADYLQKQASLRGKISAALAYPAVMICVGIGAVIFLMSSVVPKITAILIERGTPLPAPTEVLIAVSDFMKAFWWLIVIGIVTAVICFRLFIATEKGRLMFDTSLLNAPILGMLFKKRAVARFATTFSILLKSGLPALESLSIVGKVVNNMLLSRIIDQVHDRIIEGADIATPIKRSKVFPPMIGYMVAVGEQTGQLEEILDQIGESYEEEIDLAIQRMTSMVEPIIIVFLAVVVGFIIMAVLLPLLQFNQMG